MPRTSEKFINGGFDLGETKASRVYKILREAILSGQLRSGRKLFASEVANTYGISPSPVREAFTRLTAEGLVDAIPHRGAFVKELDIEQLRELYPVRSVMESYSLRLASKRLNKSELEQLEKLTERMDKLIANGQYLEMGRANYDFHMIIHKASNNKSLAMLITEVWDKTALAANIFDLVPQRSHESNNEHKALVKALRNKDTAKAERIMNKHNKRTCKLLLDTLSRRTKKEKESLLAEKIVKKRREKKRKVTSP